MKKIPKQTFTTEFKELSVKRVADGQSVPAAARELGISEQTLRNWVKAAAAGTLAGAGAKTVTPEEMELSRLRAELIRLKRENEIQPPASSTSKSSIIASGSIQPSDIAPQASFSTTGIEHRVRDSRLHDSHLLEGEKPWEAQYYVGVLYC